jgi:uncharacterized protein YndB with AHSA1/START domain
MNSDTDRIEKSVLLRAPRERVWRAISDAGEFGKWFGVQFDGSFVTNARVTGRRVGTVVDPEIAKRQRTNPSKTLEFFVDRIEPMERFSFRWHPYAVDPSIDYSKEPTTLVVFELQDAPEGTRLTVTESGFDRIPLGRRAEAFARNTEGWTIQTTLVEKYLALEA